MTIRACIGFLTTVCLVAAGGLGASRPGWALLLMLCGVVPSAFLVASLERQVFDLQRAATDTAPPTLHVSSPTGYTPIVLGALTTDDAVLYLAEGMKPVTHVVAARYQDQRVLILSHD